LDQKLARARRLLADLAWPAERFVRRRNTVAFIAEIATD
jgi:hypothetical protein